MDTVGGLANRDYSVRVIKEAVADFDQDMHNFAIQRMMNLYNAQVWTMENRKEFD
jgi:nicotinamidase-related amidase